MSRYSRNHLQSATYSNPTLLKPRRDPSSVAEQIDHIFTHLRDNTLPREPYLVSVPSNVPYNHSRRYVPTWHNGTPFTQDEEQLQYLSFVPPAIEDTLLCVVGGWSDEKGNFIPDDLEEETLSPKSKPTTRRNSPAADVQRKKISLGQYKNKVKSEVEMATDTPPRRDMEKQANKVNGVQETAKAHETEIKAVSPGPQKVNGKKHPRDDSVKPEAKLRGGHVSSDAKVDERRSASPRPAKKLKVDAPLSPIRREHESNAKQSAHAYSTKDMALPRLLSPTLPSKAETEPSLPPLLSPTIPASVLDFLSIEPSKLDKALDRHRTDSVRSLLATAGLGDSGKSPTLHPTSYGNRVRSDSAHSARSSHSANGLNRVATLAHSPGRALTPTRNGASPGPRQRHTIILKYGKRNRKRVEALIKFQPRPKRARAETTISPPPDLDPVRSKLENPRETTHAKDRQKDSRSDGATKSQKTRPAALSVSEKPTTPVPVTMNSPSIPNHHVQSHSTFSTPKKEFKSTAMQRVVSSDETHDARTPQADRLSTPQPSNHRHSPSAPTSAPAASSSNRDEWTALGKKYFELGRKIKTESTSYGTDATRTEQCLALVLMVEGLLCFMINTFALSAASSRQSADPGWRNIIPYLDFVLHHTRKQPQINGLAMQLGALCRQLVHKYDIDKLAKEALPEDPSSAASAPTPGSDGNTKTSEDADRSKQRYLDFRDQLISNTRRCQAAWLEGSRLLSPETLREEFPTTWKRRAIDFSLRGMVTERSSPKELQLLGGTYFLPLDGSASPVEGVRYAIEVLQEWSEKEKVPWKCQIEL